MEEILSSFLIISASLLLSCAVKVAYSIWWRPMKLQKHLNQQGIKGNPYKLFFGDMKEMGRLIQEAWSKPMNLTHQIAPRVFPYCYDLVQKEGKLSIIWNGTTPRVIVNDSELMKQVLSNKFGHFQKPQANPIIYQLTRGLSALEGEEWAKHRRIITPAFHLEKLKAMIPAFSTSCCGLIKQWGELVGPQGSCELDVWPELQNLTGDVISRTAFGSNYEEGKRIFELQKEQIILVLETAFAPYIPGFRFVPTYLDKEIKAMLRNLIHKKEQAMKMGESSTDDLLGLLLLQSNNCNGVQEPGTNSKNNGLTIDDVIEECKLFYFAGQETTSVWLTWTMIVLAMHPSWQERAREEVLQICGKNTPDFDTTNHFKIVTMILYEVLRLYPPVTALFQQTCKKMDLGGISLPQGIDLLLPTLLVHHDPELWGDDHEEFRPERFSDGVSKASKEQTAFFPFGWGPKICIGQHFAMIEAKMALAMILQNFSFGLSPSYTHAPYTVITLQPQYGAQVLLHRI
ncbi:cytochrome P450 CYP72A616-like [Magnolia sinica]|uniref:cytochrome P450 CYP72A616-like n=1 Tax=Magnolia sinica TaxID=86752 RepID=UPI0026584B00|nr:cytochrome P450 CYP72A616-like [Magnolia sinica]